MKLLFVTSSLHYAHRQPSNGLFLRLAFFIKVAAKISSQLDFLLFMVRPAERDPAIEADIRAFLEDLAQVPITVTLADMTELGRPATNWEQLRSTINPYHPSHSLAFHHYGNDDQLAAISAALDRQPDAIFVHRLATMSAFLKYRGPMPPIYLDNDDIEHKKYLRTLRLPPHYPGKLLIGLAYPALKRIECRALQMARLAFVCSDADRRYLLDKVGNCRIAAVPNVVPVGMSIEPLTEAPTLLFLGALGYQPNGHAADLLVRRYFPLIKAAVPSARLIIAGGNPHVVPSLASAPDGVEVRGFVDDLQSLYRETRIVVTPIASGGGTRIKIVEAAAYGKPVVSTTIGAEGIDLVDGASILIRDNEAGFVAACIDLLTDHGKAAAIGRAAHEVASRIYDRDQVIETTARLIQADLAPLI